MLNASLCRAFSTDLIFSPVCKHRNDDIIAVVFFSTQFSRKKCRMYTRTISRTGQTEWKWLGDGISIKLLWNTIFGVTNAGKYVGFLETLSAEIQKWQISPRECDSSTKNKYFDQGANIRNGFDWISLELYIYLELYERIHEIKWDDAFECTISSCFALRFVLFILTLRTNA